METTQVQPDRISWPTGIGLKNGYHPFFTMATNRDPQCGVTRFYPQVDFRKYGCVPGRAVLRVQNWYGDVPATVLVVAVPMMPTAELIPPQRGCFPADLDARLAALFARRMAETARFGMSVSEGQLHCIITAGEIVIVRLAGLLRLVEDVLRQDVGDSNAA